MPDEIISHMCREEDKVDAHLWGYDFATMIHINSLQSFKSVNQVVARMSMKHLLSRLRVESMMQVMELHNVGFVVQGLRGPDLPLLEKTSHAQMKQNLKEQAKKLAAKGKNQDILFLPPPLFNETLHKITANFINDCLGLEETGCAVSGKLQPYDQMTSVTDVRNMLSPVAVGGVAVKDDGSPWPEEIPILNPECEHICSDCRGPLGQGAMPRHALANNLWIGEVPPELRQLWYVEKLVIQHVCHIVLFVKVAGSHRKAIAHVISFPVSIYLVNAMMPPP
ncbi:hypothetical protein EV715DRAFT_288351 [Schizophyllum commune]